MEESAGKTLLKATERLLPCRNRSASKATPTCCTKSHVPVQGKTVFALEKRGPCKPGYSQLEALACRMPCSHLEEKHLQDWPCGGTKWESHVKGTHHLVAGAGTAAQLHQNP